MWVASLRGGGERVASPLCSAAHPPRVADPIRKACLQSPWPTLSPFSLKMPRPWHPTPTIPFPIFKQKEVNSGGAATCAQGHRQRGEGCPKSTPQGPQGPRVGFVLLSLGAAGNGEVPPSP